jgi:hypothetical protein
MKKILFTLVVLMFAGQAWAAVDISGAQVGGTDEAIISFDARTEPNLVRAFSFNIQADNDANIIAVTGVNPGYYIYPGTIQIDAAGVVTDYGSPAAPQSDLPSDTLPGIDSNGVTVELASLYAPVGPSSPNAPDPCGPILSIRVSKPCCLTITANVARAGSTGVVMESPDQVVTVNLPGSICIDWSDECMKTTHPRYADWEAWGKPACWCYAKQCRGDINGALFLAKPVTGADLIIFKAAFNKTDAELAQVTNGICADLNMAPFLGKRVTGADLIIFKQYFNLADTSVPECPSENINYWEVP